MYHCVTALCWVPDESKKWGAQEQRGVGEQKGRKQRQDGGTGTNRELVQGKGQDGGALCAT